MGCGITRHSQVTAFESNAAKIRPKPIGQLSKSVTWTSNIEKSAEFPMEPATEKSSETPTRSTTTERQAEVPSEQVVPKTLATTMTEPVEPTTAKAPATPTEPTTDTPVAPTEPIGDKCTEATAEPTTDEKQVEVPPEQVVPKTLATTLTAEAPGLPFETLAKSVAPTEPIGDECTEEPPNMTDPTAAEIISVTRSNEESDIPHRSSKWKALRGVMQFTRRVAFSAESPNQFTRRVAFSAESPNQVLQGAWRPPVFAKSEEDRASLGATLRDSKDSKLPVLFGVLSADVLALVIDAFQEKNVAAGETVITHGANGDFFYVVKSGFFEVLVKSSTDKVPRKVWEAGKGFSFGEIALLHDAPRSATVIAREESVVWQLDTATFNMSVILAQHIKIQERIEFLKMRQIFSNFSAGTIQQLSELTHEEDFDTDEPIVEQGDQDDKLFILRTGSAVACIKGDQGEFEVKHYSAGDHFGELAVLTLEPRKASVYSKEKTSCYYISSRAFCRVVGSLTDVLLRAEGDYEKYEECSKVQSVTKWGKVKGVLSLCDTYIKETEVSEPEGALATFEDQMKLHVARTELVAPTDEFKVMDSLCHVFFTLAVGRKFTDSTPIVARLGSRAMQETAEDFCTCKFENARYQLKVPPICSMLCQKGQKPGIQETPNQDNVFQLTTKDGVDIYGVCDGHGPFGHLVSFRLIQTVPYYLTSHPYFDTDKKLAITQALAQAQTDLREFARVENLNFDMSGSTVSILILAKQEIHIATLGDSRIMVSSYGRHDSRLIYISTDHTPDLPGEKARIEGAGSPPGEVRDGRIYVKGQIYPGLTMSRAMGDFCCAERGVTQEPNYECIAIQPGDQWYALVASDGVWEFLDGEQVTSLSAKKLRLKGPNETLRFVVDASRKRWKHYQGDYCDDISAILVQWNSKSQDEQTMHTVHIEM
eukprot:GEMP01001571.1.p1 GENE.GEMP01001571.1~~GEMP01001571.1.p1  ORF type:complete len:934 (+),score=192.77 GEMP01001571.1:272-3073(+)